MSTYLSLIPSSSNRLSHILPHSFQVGGGHKSLNLKVAKSSHKVASPQGLASPTYSHRYFSQASTSIWMDVQLPTFPSLKKNLNVDVCIVGSGIAGLTCAYTLTKQGKSVAILDQGPIGGGQTARTTAHLTWVLDDRFSHLKKLFGEKGARDAAESHAAAIDYIEKIVETEKIDCDFKRVDGYLFVPPNESKNILDKELNVIREIGMPVHSVEKAPFPCNFDTGRCLHFPGQAQFHALKYLQGLTEVIAKRGGLFFGDTHVNHFKDGSPCIVNTALGSTITAQAVIAATCTPINNRFMIHPKQGAYRSYVIAAPIPKNIVPAALYWDTADPYHYIRTQKYSSDSDWLIIGGEDHKTGQDKEIKAKYNHLEEWGRTRFPQMGEVLYRWSGQVFEPIDALAFIGRNPLDKNIYIVTGDSGNGMTHGTLSGILIPDLILGKDNPWEHLYNPARKTVSSAPEFLHESLNMVQQYRDWFTPGEKIKIADLPLGEGVILRRGLRKIAVYRDENSQLHINSARCPHLEGCVRWNPGEKSWDCPCHGSRFDGYGKVINGPAIDNLSPYTKL
jgi:glycine/D-amino acid oxidase-like deaminating enzyme/nitrite reductase/ring-hydroxylating ferredoxin subunit